MATLLGSTDWRTFSSLQNVVEHDGLKGCALGLGSSQIIQDVFFLEPMFYSVFKTCSMTSTYFELDTYNQTHKPTQVIPQWLIKLNHSHLPMNNGIALHTSPAAVSVQLSFQGILDDHLFSCSCSFGLIIWLWPLWFPSDFSGDWSPKGHSDY